MTGLHNIQAAVVLGCITARLGCITIRLDCVTIRLDCVTIRVGCRLRCKKTVQLTCVYFTRWFSTYSTVCACPCLCVALLVSHS